MPTFTIKRNDTLPALLATLTRNNGVTVDATGATARFIMRSQRGVLKVDAAATIVVDSPAQVRYSWQAADTNNSGTYNAEIEVTYSGGAIETFPNSGYITVEIVDDL